MFSTNFSLFESSDFTIKRFKTHVKQNSFYDKKMDLSFYDKTDHLISKMFLIIFCFDNLLINGLTT